MKIFGNNARFRKFCATTTGLAALTMGVAGSASHQAKASYAPPSWQNNAVIYCVNPQIFSTSGLSGIDAQISRLKTLGVNVLWLMPFQTVGKSVTFAGTYHASSGSPYCISNLEGIDPSEGTAAQLKTLLSDAHAAGMHVILDVALNQTSWDNPLLTQHPEYYHHSDGNSSNPNSIQAFDNFPDIAWIDISSPSTAGAQYMQSVCQYWLSQGFDGFRFDTADDTDNSNRSFSQSFAESLYNTINSGNTLMWLGEENDSALAFAPYTLDYDWDISYGGDSDLQNTAKNGNGVNQLESQVNAYTGGVGSFPANFQHMDMLQDWDTDEDYNTCGGFSQALDAAAFNLTLSGVPLVYNGEEVGNDVGGDNTHTQIDWNSPNATKFQAFYKTMIADRLAHPALQQGSLNFEPNNNGNASVATYDRVSPSGSDECYVEINFSGGPISGTCTVPTGSGSWTDISPSVSPGGTSHTLPSTGNFSLAAYDYAVFTRGTAAAPATPANFTATAGNGQVTLSWTASSGATSYNVYRSTTSGNEGTVAYNAGITSTSFIDTSVTNGTKYYYKVAAVNSVGTSAQSGEQSATPTTSAATGSLSGTLTPVTSVTTYNLTSLGTADWAAWGDNGGYDHDNGGGNKISNIAASGGSLNAFPSNFLGFTWTNGTPDASASGETQGYYNNGGSGDGFSFTVPASTTAQTLYVYVGGYNSEATLTATLSDNSAAAYTSSALSTSTSSGSYYGIYKLTFSAASANQTLTVKWLQNGTGTNITEYAAYLTGGTAASAPATPANFAGTAGNAQATLTWTASSGATSYNIYKSQTSGGEGTTAYNAGITSTSFVDTNVTNGTTYYYKVAAVSSAGTSAQSNEVAVKPVATGSLTGSVSAASGTVNLTSVGTTDWAAYGFNTSAYDHTSAGKISNVTAVGGSLNSFPETALGFTWTNGTPDASETNEQKGFYNNGGSGDGFSFTVPAGTTAQNLNVYVGGYAAGGTLTATLSDGSAPVYTDSSQSNSGNSFYSNYLLAFKAASAGQTLTVKWIQNGAGTNITLYGAALH